MTLYGIILYCLFFGFLTAFIALRKGYDAHSWFWLGVVLGIIATGILLFQPNKLKRNKNVPDPVSE